MQQQEKSKQTTRDNKKKVHNENKLNFNFEQRSDESPDSSANEGNQTRSNTSN
jgi:hypothetical protein